jgi:class 3 adenylate cyclase/tetratricopeptide (TPR) repeat protein
MKCPKCQFENREGARFCNECGHKFEIACPGCGTANRPGSKFCDECGYDLNKPSEAPAIDYSQPQAYTPKFLADKILQSKSALEGERKQVTVLFVDLKGSMDLAEQVDPEEWHRILDRFFQILAEGVHRFEGTINQYTGDGIMALFGAPIAHEDHAHRACYAALYLSEQLRRYANELRLSKGLNFAVRMGLNSGEVVVGKIGDDLRMDYTAQGHTVGLASRMEQIAEPGKVYLAQDTAKAVQGYFVLEDLGEVRVSGIGHPVRVSELRGVGTLRTRLEVSRARGFSRFVGRAEELQALEAALSRARESQAQVVGVVGEAGSGKSRLCYEFLERCHARGLTTFQAHGVAHGKSTPLVPILELYRDYYGISDQDSDRVAREKIAGRLLLLDEAFRDALPLTFEFLGVGDPEQAAPRMDPEVRQRQLFAIMKRVIQRTGQEQVTVTLLEDLHWFDGASLAFVEQFVEAAQGTRGLLVVTFRPEFHAGWMQKSYYQQVPLMPLGSEAIRELLGDLLGTDPSLVGLAEGIQERTAGNPFFIEEVVQSLVESGQLEGTRGAYRLTRQVAEILVPDTVQAVLSARIDRQGEREKQVLQMASVIGKTFSEGVLARIAELDLRASLEVLKAAEFIYESSIYPELEYAFKHPLTQEVAYGSQLGERRRRIHAAVARSLVELESEKLNEHAALIAHHWELAGDHLEAARWHRRAAEWVGMSDVEEAKRHWQLVRTLCREATETTEAIELGIVSCRQLLITGWFLGLPEEDEREIFEEGKRLIGLIGDREAEAHLEYSYSLARTINHGDLQGGLAHGLEAERLAEQAGSPDQALIFAGSRILTLQYMGRLHEAIPLLDRTIEATRDRPEAGLDVWGMSHYVWATYARGWLEWFTGDFEKARQMLELSIREARDRGERDIEAWALAALAGSAQIAGDFEAGLIAARRSAEIVENVGSPLSRDIAHAPLGLMLAVNGLHEEAITLLEHKLRTVKDRRRNLGQRPALLAYLAEAHRAAGNLVEARAAAEAGIFEGQRLGAQLEEAQAQHTLARVLLKQNEEEGAQEVRKTLDRADALYVKTGARNFQALVRLDRAELSNITGDYGTREQELNQALQLFREMKAPIRVREVEKLLADGKRGPTDPPEAGKIRGA